MQVLEHTHRWETEAHFVSMRFGEDTKCVIMVVRNKHTKLTLQGTSPTWDEALAVLPGRLTEAGIPVDAHLGPSLRAYTYLVAPGVTLEVTHITSDAHGRAQWTIETGWRFVDDEDEDPGPFTEPTIEASGFAPDWDTALVHGGLAVKIVLDADAALKAIGK